MKVEDSATSAKAESSSLTKEEDNNKPGDSSDKGKNTTDRVGDIYEVLFGLLSAVVKES